MIGSRRKSKPTAFKIISGGQTGADRAALDFAIAHKIRHGGWCPKGRLAEDGQLLKKYRLKEATSSYPAVRTRWNVRDSDGTVIFSLKKRLSGGTKLTRDLARKFKKPLLVIVAPGRNAARTLERFVREHNANVLNVAGPREKGSRAFMRLRAGCWSAGTLATRILRRLQAVAWQPELCFRVCPY